MNLKALLDEAFDSWSRRLPQEHRLVYVVMKGRVEFLMARDHY